MSVEMVVKKKGMTGVSVFFHYWPRPGPFVPWLG